MAERIDIHPDICNGRPVIAGTRIPVFFKPSWSFWVQAIP